MNSSDSKKGILRNAATRTRRPGLVPIGIVSALALAGAAMVGPAMAAPPGARGDLPDLNHFRCYSVVGGHVHLPPLVALRDQFDDRLDPNNENREIWAVGLPVAFCPPVEKTIYGPPGPDKTTGYDDHPDHHLTMYEIYHYDPDGQTPIRDVNWNVKVDNQFGRQTLFAGKPALLGVPTQKVEFDGETTNHGPPDGLSHFKCYKAKGQSVNVAATLSDEEFEQQIPIIVRDPILFCNPTDKTFGSTSERLNRDAHLTCYDIDLASQIGAASLHDVGIDNQFTDVATGIDTSLTVMTDERMLCVPSLKVGILATPGSLTSGP